MNRTFDVKNLETLKGCFGERDENAKYLAERFGVRINTHEGQIVIEGEEEGVNKAADTLELISKMLDKGEHVKPKDVRVYADMTENGDNDAYDKLLSVITITAKGRQVRPKTYGQAKYVDAIRNNTVVFGVGPAGTGKTYLAVALAVAAYKAHLAERIILTRPAVEAGEKLGFLPGDLGAKVDPYLRPLYDALQEMLGLDAYNRMIERGVIEIAPLAYMRGRTLSNAFIILDEAQNTTKEQMKMFLTRLGEGSKIVVTGDITQIDLPFGKRSGLIEAIEILGGVKDIDVIRLTGRDVVRHELVMRIIDAYERKEKDEEGNNSRKGNDEE